MSLFKPTKYKSLSSIDRKTLLKSYGNELRDLDQQIKEDQSKRNHAIDENIEFNTQQKNKILNQFQNTLQREKKQFQIGFLKNYQDGDKDKHLSQTQNVRRVLALKQKFAEIENVILRKSKQFNKDTEQKFDQELHKFWVNQQEHFETFIAERNLRHDSIKNKLRQFFDLEQVTRINQFQNVFNSTLKSLDQHTKEILCQINKDPSNVFLDYRKADVLLYKTTNELGQRCLSALRDELKLALALGLRELTDYNLERALNIAEIIVNDLNTQLNTSKKGNVTYEKLSKKVEKELGFKAEEGKFAEILSLIKTETNFYNQEIVFLFTSLYDAKKREFGNSLSSEALDKLFDQDEAYRRIQGEAAQFILQKVSETSFYLTFIELGIRELNIYKNGNISEKAKFASDRKEVFENLKNKIADEFDNYFDEKNICSAVKEKINRSQIEKFVFEHLTRKYYIQRQEPAYNLGKNKLSVDESVNLISQKLDNQLQLYKPDRVIQPNSIDKKTPSASQCA